MIYGNTIFELGQDPNDAQTTDEFESKNQVMEVSPMLINDDKFMNVNGIQIVLDTDITKNLFSFKSLSASIQSDNDELLLLIYGELVSSNEVYSFSTELFKSQIEEYKTMLNTTMRILDNINFGIYNYFKYAITDNSDEKEETVLAKTHKDIVDGICYLLCKCEEQYRKINNLPPALPEDKPYILSNNVIKKVQYAYSFKLNFETIIKGI